MIVYDENENKYEGPIVATDDVKPDAIVFVNFKAFLTRVQCKVKSFRSSIQ